MPALMCMSECERGSESVCVSVYVAAAATCAAAALLLLACLSLSLLVPVRCQAVRGARLTE